MQPNVLHVPFYMSRLSADEMAALESLAWDGRHKIRRIADWIIEVIADERSRRGTPKEKHKPEIPLLTWSESDIADALDWFAIMQMAPLYGDSEAHEFLGAVGTILIAFVSRRIRNAANQAGK